MNKFVTTLVVIVLLAFIFWKYILPKEEPVDLKPYQGKIDSLNIQINILSYKNDSLETFISYLEYEKDSLFSVNENLKYRITDLKDQLKKAKTNVPYTPQQVDSFFIDRYSRDYVPALQDTIFIPVQVARSIIIDLEEANINKAIVKAQDSTINNLEQFIKNREDVISSLRMKEFNYKSMDSLRLEQQVNYEKQLELLKADIKKYNKKLKFSKITNILVGAAAVGFVITNK
jgi:predicted RNase H-like nuclease (RuvC/YqgF family)